MRATAGTTSRRSGTSWPSAGSFPFVNFVWPYRSVKELTEEHGATLARRIVTPWWLLWVLSAILQLTVVNSAYEYAPLNAGASTAADLDGLAKYSAFIGFLNAFVAVLAVALVLATTAAVRARLDGDEDEDGDGDE